MFGPDKCGLDYKVKLPKSAPVAQLGKLLWWVSGHEARHAFKGGCAPWGLFSVALKNALFVNCSSPNLPITAPPLARPFSFRVLHTASLTAYKCQWLLNCHETNTSSLVSNCCKLFTQQHDSTVSSHLAVAIQPPII